MKLNDPHFWHLLSRIDGHLKKFFENRSIGPTSIATFPLGNLLKVRARSIQLREVANFPFRYYATVYIQRTSKSELKTYFQF